jgi:acyl-homoserine lactone acylase PvdQ
VAPGRTGAFQRLATPRGAVATAIGTLSPDLAERLRATWEALNNGWNQWVLNYTQSKQLNLLKNLGFESPGWEDLGRLLIGLVVLLSLAGAAWTLWERHQHDPWLRLLARTRQKLAAAGVDLPPNAPPREMARAMREQLAAHAGSESLHDWLLRLEQWRYAPPAASSGAVSAVVSARRRLATLQREFRHLPWPS